MTDFSLIVATIGRAAEIGRLVESLIAQTDKSFELIVVDQNADQRLEPYLEQARAGGLHVVHERQATPGLALARNRGIALATSPWIGFPDDDCWYEPDAVQHLRSATKSVPAPLGLVADWVEQSAHRGVLPDGPLSLHRWRRFRDGDASSISLFFRRDLLVELGGFDVRFGVGQWFGAAEETDLLLRALATGAMIKRCPFAQVHHHYSTESRSTLMVAAKHARNRARGTGAIYAKHRLAQWVVVRGVVAPILVPVAKLQFRKAFIGWFMALGRIEGSRAWKQVQKP